jgi:hypothetical protein
MPASEQAAYGQADRSFLAQNNLLQVSENAIEGIVHTLSASGEESRSASEGELQRQDARDVF